MCIGRAVFIGRGRKQNALPLLSGSEHDLHSITVVFFSIWGTEANWFSWHWKFSPIDVGSLAARPIQGNIDNSSLYFLIFGLLLPMTLSTSQWNASGTLVIKSQIHIVIWYMWRKDVLKGLLKALSWNKCLSFCNISRQLSSTLTENSNSGLVPEESILYSDILMIFFRNKRIKDASHLNDSKWESFMWSRVSILLDIFEEWPGRRRGNRNSVALYCESLLSASNIPWNVDACPLYRYISVSFFLTPAGTVSAALTVVRCGSINATYLSLMTIGKSNDIYIIYNYFFT